RIDKGTHKAVDRFRDFARIVSKNNTKTCWVLKCDIRKFFASIDHEILKSILEKHIQNKETLSLLENIIKSFTNSTLSHQFGKTPHITQNSPWRTLGKGLPLGNLTSQLLVNIYMNEFDQHMKHKLKVKYYIRYADDFVILSEDIKYLEILLVQISKFLNTKLKLQMHPYKVFIKTLASGIDFLGWINFPKHRSLRTSTKKRMFRNLERNGYKEESLNSYLGMLLHGDGWKLEQKIKL
ncbi:group II intron reverse transcriptase domain-containing protein, partial [Candidatus Nomurabacteria bacterium]|nr:group II intron reverse transcriptase domain-containing protein [Candidatus Nomurabacteria bacterium]